MKKLSKFALGAALFLVLSGGLLALSGRVMGGHTTIELNRYGRTIVVTPFGIRDFRPNNPVAYAVERADVNDVAPTLAMGATSATIEDIQSLTTLDINVSIADVSVQKGEDFSVELTWQDERTRLYSEVNDGVLTVWDEDEEYDFMGIDVKGGTVIITCPAGTLFDSVYIDSDLGTIELSGCSADSLTVSADLGSVHLADVTAETAELDLSMGELSAARFVVNGLLTIENHMGSVELKGTFHDMDLTADMGAITVKTSLPKSEYTWDLSTDMGGIELNGSAYSGGGGRVTDEINGGSFSTGMGNRVSGGNGGYSLSAHSSMGSVSVDFG